MQFPMETKLLKELSMSMHLTETEILEESIATFLDRNLRNAALEMEKLKQKYAVESPQDLQKKIECNEVKAHPAWEELIEWENLQKMYVAGRC